VTLDKHGGPSLEAIVDSGELRLPILHPGGLESTRQLAELCRVGPSRLLLDVASGNASGARSKIRSNGISIATLALRKPASLRIASNFVAPACAPSE